MDDNGGGRSLIRTPYQHEEALSPERIPKRNLRVEQQRHRSRSFPGKETPRELIVLVLLELLTFAPLPYRRRLRCDIRHLLYSYSFNFGKVLLDTVTGMK